MKIGVNAAPLAKPFTGIGQYTKNLFKELAKIDSENEYILIAHEKVDIMGYPRNVRFEILPEKKIPLAGLRKTWWEQISLPEFFEKEKVDVAFFPYPSNPWTKDWYKKGIKTVVTVHDCIPWKYKKYRKSILSKMYHAQTKKAVKMADIVFTVSQVSKDDVVKVCGVGPEKVYVVYNDAGEIYKRRGDSVESLRRFGLKEGQYFMYCGGYDDRKNVRFLVDEYFRSDCDFPLVLVGGKLFKNNLYSSFDNLIDEKIIKTGFLEEKDIAALYQNCTAFVHFSKEEGFNIPLLEAANCGAPLILSDIPIHREIAQNAAIFAELREGAGAAAMNRCLKDTVSERLSEASKILCPRYSWERSAQKVKDMLFS